MKHFTVDPGSGMPGSPITLTGLKIPAADRTSLVVFVGSDPTLYNFLDDGTLVAIVPMYMESSAWPAPPPAPQTVKVYKGKTLLAESAKPFQVLPLAKAPGTTQRIATDLDGIATSFDGAISAFPMPDEMGTADAQAISKMLHALGSGGVNSMQAVVDGTAPLLNGQTVNLDLVDAVLASSGIAELYDKYAEGVAEFRTQGAIPTGTCKGPDAPDYNLACEMQYQAWLKDFADQVIGKTMKSTTYKVLSKVAGFIAIFVPPAGIPLAITTIADFLLNKIAPALYPSKFKKFELTLHNPKVVPGDTTAASFQITAGNEPLEMTLSELVDVTLKVLETVLPEVKTAEEVEAEEKAIQATKETIAGLSWFTKQVNATVGTAKDIIGNAVSWALDQYTEVLKTYNDQQPDPSKQFADPKIVVVPDLDWPPVTIQPTSVALLTLWQGDSTIVTSLEKSASFLDWRALKPGQTYVVARPRGPGKTSQVFFPTSFPFIPKETDLAAFGNASTESNHVTVEVESGTVDYSLGAQGSHSADGSAPPSSAGASGDGTSMQPNEVDAWMWNDRWSLASKSPDNSWLWITCDTPFTQLGATITINPQVTPGCGMTWYDDPANPNAGGTTSSGLFSFDTCTVISDDGTRPTAVRFTGSFGGTFLVTTGLLGGTVKQENDDMTGTFDAVFTLDDTVSASSPNVTAIEQQCNGWPPGP